MIQNKLSIEKPRLSRGFFRLLKTNFYKPDSSFCKLAIKIKTIRLT